MPAKSTSSKPDHALPCWVDQLGAEPPDRKTGRVGGADGSFIGNRHRQQTDVNLPVVHPDLEALLSISEAAAILSVSEKTVRRLIKSGAIHCVRVGKSVRIRPAELVAYINRK